VKLGRETPRLCLTYKYVARRHNCPQPHHAPSIAFPRLDLLEIADGSPRRKLARRSKNAPPSQLTFTCENNNIPRTCKWQYKSVAGGLEI
jgi:hypothetical protein